MIRAIIQEGTIRPIEPLPPEWTDGREVVVRVEEDEQSVDLESLDQWYRDLQELGPARYAPGEREEIQAFLAEADARAKDSVRREMGLP